MLAAGTILVLASISAADQPRLYEFTAPWCPACRRVEPVVAELKAQGVPIQHVDVDQQPAWTKQAKVSSLPCFIAVANGHEVGRLVGTASRSELSGLYLQAVQHSRRTAAARDANTQRDVLEKDGDDTGMVRGQTPSRPSPGKRLGRALSNLRGRAEQKPACRCSGQCVCDPPAQGQCDPPAQGQTVAAGPTTDPVRPVGHTAAAPILDPSTATQRALEATVRIKIVDEVGQSYGTGTIIDVHADEALVLTCGHIFRDSDGKGRIVCDSFAPGATPAIEGKLISYDMRRDVGLISFHPGVKVTAASVGGLGHRPREGDPVFCVGCNRGADPTVMENKIVAVNRYHGPPNLVVGGRPMDGRSGGGLFTKEGLLIGVCNAADPEYDEGLYAALGNVHSQLDAAGLGYIYRQQPPGIARHDSRATRTWAADQNVQPRSQVIPASLPLTSQATPGTPAPGPAADPQVRHTPPAGAPPLLASTGRKGEVQEQELICIVRAPNDPQPKSVFVLDRPSTTLLNQLAAEANRRGPHLATQMHVDNDADAVTQRRPAGGGLRSADDRPRSGNTAPGRQHEGDWRSLVPTGPVSQQAVP